MLAAVHVRTKGNAIVVEMSPALQAENLKAAGVGKNGSLPGHEFVNSARGLDRRASRPQPQMIGVGENDLRLRLPQVSRRQSFDRCRSSDRHEAWGFHDAVREL